MFPSGGVGMGHGRWRRMWKLFHEALERTGHDRLAFLDKVCAGDAELRAQLEQLLEAHESGEGILDEARPSNEGLNPPADPLLGERIGPYRIADVIGEGGMGVVYAAEQDAPVRRRVALKLIRLGMDTREVVRRFEAERQALALMSHPAIASVHDGGATRDGRPYFVMELVEGVPVTRYCDEQRLETRERIELFLRICEGVQHAHQKGLIHRDLKPSNVLVAQGDKGSLPKIIDFGVAKATGQRLTEQTMFTALGAWVGTPEYMSPEQADPAAQDVDTRSDVYALGVMLYELLVGALPFEPEDLRRAGFDEIRRRIREDEPSKPSTRIGTLGGERSNEAARSRRTDVATLRRQLSGDLDWITMRALEKDRERRYGSVAELADDLRRHLGHEPVHAGPPGAAYRVSKFIRRHRAGVGFATALFVVLLGFAVTMTVQAGRIARERDRANQEAARAGREAETAEQVTDFLTGLFRVSRPSEARGNTVTAREILDRGAQRIDEELQDQPEVRARMLATIGNVYRSLGLYDDAEGPLAQSLAIREQLNGRDSSWAETLRMIGELRHKQGRIEESERLLRQALETLKRTAPPGDGRLIVSKRSLADLLQLTGDYDESIALYEEALAALEQTVDEDHPQVLECVLQMAYTFRDADRLDEARASLQRALALGERIHDPEHPVVGSILNALGILHWTVGEFEEATPIFERSLRIAEEAFPPEHPRLASMRNNMGRILMDAGDLEAARPYHERALAVREKILGPDHPETATSLVNLGLLARDTGDHAKAIDYFERTIRIREDKLGPNHRYLAEPLSGLADSLQATGRHAESRPLYERAIRIREAILGPNHRDLIGPLTGYARLLRATGRDAEADAVLARIESIKNGRE